jgi:hypothetical protein
MMMMCSMKNKPEMNAIRRPTEKLHKMSPWTIMMKLMTTRQKL